MRKQLKYISVIMTVLMLLCLTGCTTKDSKKTALDPKNPTAISVWHYYNGAQLEAFNEMVDQYNETQGKEKGIVVNGFSQGSVNDLQFNVMNAVTGKVGASEVPNVFAAYADTAYELDQMGVLVDIANYLTEEQKKVYIDNYLSEGDFNHSGSMKIFPIAKSTELFLLNETDWKAFAEATGATYNDFSTVEGLVETAKRYYEWTDSLTEASDDGKAFYGRDAMANYMLIGGMQQGCEIFSVKDGKAMINFDHDVIRKLWDNYYIPTVKGYFASSGRFRSDDIKTGNIIAFTGSSSGATFFPKKVTTEDSEYDITMSVFPAPQFAGEKRYAVQQGAGMVVTQGNEAEIEASLDFLLWFTQDERNILFSINSGYLPVTKSANSMEMIRKQNPEIEPVMEEILTVAVETVQGNSMYTTRAFKNGVSARSILENRMHDQATTDRNLVKSAMENGKTAEEAMAEYISEDYFENWYNSVLDELEKLEIN